MLPISKMWYLRLGRKHTLSSRRAIHCSSLTICFHMCLRKERGCFVNKLYKSWEILVTLQLLSDCCVVFWTKESEKQDTIIFSYKPIKKRKRFHTWKCQLTMTEIGNIPLIWKCHVTVTKNFAYKSKEMQLKKHSLTFIHKNKPLPSATSFPSHSPMVYKTTAHMDKLTFTNYVGFGKCQDRFGQFYWSKNDSDYLEVKLNVFKKDYNKEFQMVEILTVGEAYFNQFMRLTNQLVIAAENFATEENLTAVLLPTISKDMDEQLKLAHKVVDVMDGANKTDLCDSAAVQWGQDWELFVWNLIFCKGGGRKVFNKLCMWVIKLMNLPECLMYRILYMIKSLINPVLTSYKCNFVSLLFIIFLSFRVRMSWNIGDNQKLLPKKLTLPVVEMQQLSDIEEIDSKQEVSCLRWTIENVGKKVCVNFQTDTDKLTVVVYRYRNSLYLKDIEVDLNWTEYQSLLAKRVYLLSYIDKFHKRCIALDLTTVHK